MKNLKLTLFIALAGMLFSCDDATNILQPGEFNESAAFRTLEDMELNLSGVYNAMSGETQIGFTSIFTDEAAVGVANGGQNLDDIRWVVQPNSGGPTNMWIQNYRLINFANRLIRGAQLITPTEAELPTYNKIIAEAHALRAFGHFQLLTYFSTDLKNPEALGVIKMDFVPTIEQVFPRSTNAEVFELIDADLVFAEANLGNPTNYKFITQNFIRAFRARMALYRGDYPKALANAEALISSVPLTPAAQYQNMFRDLVPGEVIFAMDRPINKATIGSLFYFNQPTRDGGAFLEMNRALYNKLDDANDIRKNTFIIPEGANGSLIVPRNQVDEVANYLFADILLIGKYPGKPGAPLNNDIKVFRVSEMYFIKAEALAAAGNINGDANSVASVLKQVRDARRLAGTPATALPVYANATEAWADILAERRLELCFEGHRYVDIKRLGQLAGNVSVDRYFRDCEPYGSCSILNTDYRFTLPIPLVETRVNPVINAQQNPNY
jgi:hypothetical protein